MLGERIKLWYAKSDKLKALQANREFIGNANIGNSLCINILVYAQYDLTIWKLFKKLWEELLFINITIKREKSYCCCIVEWILTHFLPFIVCFFFWKKNNFSVQKISHTYIFPKIKRKYRVFINIFSHVQKSKIQQ